MQKIPFCDPLNDDSFSIYKDYQPIYKKSLTKLRKCARALENMGWHKSQARPQIGQKIRYLNVPISNFHQRCISVVDFTLSNFKVRLPLPVENETNKLATVLVADNTGDQPGNGRACGVSPGRDSSEQNMHSVQSRQPDGLLTVPTH